MSTDTISFIVIGIIFALIILINFCYCHLTVGHQKITIRDKGIRVESGGTADIPVTQSHYMIYTTRGEALKNTNSIWFWKFKSDELQGKLQRGHTYYVKTYGVRIPFLGMYKHIITAREVKKKSPTKKPTKK